MVALASGYWSVLRGPQILERDDNPRLVETELRIQRGRIFDQNNVILAETLGDPDDLRRVYPVPSASHVTGYYSFRHGTSGIENTLDSTLRGDSDDFWQQFWLYNTLHESQIGGDVRLTIDAQLQQAADEALDENQGAIVLLNIAEGAVEAMVSHPNYDPNQLDDQFNELTENEAAPLLNRATQGQYQPGLVLQPFLIASALDAGLIKLEDLVEGMNDAVMVNGGQLQCVGPLEEESTWLRALQSRCPNPTLKLADILGSGGMFNTFGDFGLLSSPEIEIETEEPSVDEIQDSRMAAIGQDSLSVSPLQVLLAWATLANGGQKQAINVMDAVRGPHGEWEENDKEESSQRIIQVSTADMILDALPRHQGYAEYAVPVLSGPEGATNTWYLGLTPGDSPQYAVVVVLEDNESIIDVEQIGRTMLGFATG